MLGDVSAISLRSPLYSLSSAYRSHPRGQSGRWWGNRARGLGCAAASSSAIVNAISCAIARMEGSNPLLAANNNPGNLRSGPGQIGTANGFAVFPTLADGWAALTARVQSGIDAGQTLQTFFAGTPCNNPPENTCGGYAPSADSNDPAKYAANVSTWTGIDATVPLAQLQSPSIPVSGDSGVLGTDTATGYATDSGSADSGVSSAVSSLADSLGVDPLVLGLAAVGLALGIYLMLGRH
jgi:hypothetical protein